MRDKYELRKLGMPYSIENVLVNNLGVNLKVMEFFNGKEVIWGITEITSYKGEKSIRSSLFFENMVDENGKDLERFIYLKDNTILVHGKLNGSEVLCRFNKEPGPLLEIADFGGKDVTIDVSRVDTAFVKYHENGLPKCLFFDYYKFKICSNIMDVLFKNNYFLKSFPYGDKVRVVMGRLTYCPIMVKQFGCDVNKDDVILMPLDENGLLDEKKMLEEFKKDKKDLGISLETYKKAISDDFSNTLFKLRVYEFGITTRINKYEDYISRGRNR